MCDRDPELSKAVITNTDAWKLYNIDEDRTETPDLAASEPERVERMQQDWDSWAAKVEANLTLREDLAELLDAEVRYDESGLSRLCC